MTDNLATITAEAQAKIVEIEILRERVARKFFRMINSDYYQNIIRQIEVDPDQVSIEVYLEVLDQKDSLREQLMNYDKALLLLKGDTEDDF